MRPAVEEFEERGDKSEEPPQATAGLSTWKQLQTEAGPGNVQTGLRLPDPRGHPSPDKPITWYASDNGSGLTNAELLQRLPVQFNT